MPVTVSRGLHGHNEAPPAGRAPCCRACLRLTAAREPAAGRIGPGRAAQPASAQQTAQANRRLQLWERRCAPRLPAAGPAPAGALPTGGCPRSLPTAAHAFQNVKAMQADEGSSFILDGVFTRRPEGGCTGGQAGRMRWWPRAARAKTSMRLAGQLQDVIGLQQPITCITWYALLSLAVLAVCLHAGLTLMVRGSAAGMRAPAAWMAKLLDMATLARRGSKPRSRLRACCDPCRMVGESAGSSPWGACRWGFMSACTEADGQGLGGLESYTPGGQWAPVQHQALPLLMLRPCLEWARQRHCVLRQSLATPGPQWSSSAVQPLRSA